MTARRLGRMSLRARLVLLTVGLLTVGLAVGAIVAVNLLQGYLIGRIDDQLRPVAEIFSQVPWRQLEQNDRAARPDAVSAGLDLLGDPYIAFLAADGTPRRELPGPGRSGPQLPRLDSAMVADRGGQPFDVPGRADTGPWRMIAVAHRPAPATRPGSEPTDGIVVVAAPRAAADATISRLRTISVITGSALLIVLATVGAFAVRAGLRPLHRIEQTAAAIAGGKLSHRIPYLAPSTTEIGRLSAALNGMLVQLETAFADRAASEEAMRRFVADVSHELRTPLFGIKGFTELYQMGGLSDPADLDRTMRHIDAEAGRLARLTEDLLLLAQLDRAAGSGPDTDLARPPLPLGPTDLRTLAADARHDLHALDPTRPVSLTGVGGGTAGTAQILGDEARLRQVVVNLVGNVIAHTPAGTAVRIGVGTVDGQAVLEIEDSGPGLTPEQAALVFDRFYRVDRSRARGEIGGAGLGLAIVKSIVDTHGGWVEVDTAPGAGATFRILFPILDE